MVIELCKVMIVYGMRLGIDMWVITPCRVVLEVIGVCVRAKSGVLLGLGVEREVVLGV